jgi:hypothetical protein
VRIRVKLLRVLDNTSKHIHGGSFKIHFSMFRKNIFLKNVSSQTENTDLIFLENNASQMRLYLSEFL